MATTTIEQMLEGITNVHYGPSGSGGYHFWYGTMDGQKFPINLDRQKAYPYARVRPGQLQKEPGNGSNFFRYCPLLYTDWDLALQLIKRRGNEDWLGFQRELMLHDLNALRRQLRLGWLVEDGGMVHPTLGFAQLCITSHFSE